jgi:outer membrane protein TolC
MKRYYYFLFVIIIFSKSDLYAQRRDDSIHEFSLEQCIQFAYTHSPLLNQSVLDQQITEHGIKSRLADWYPQIRFDYNVQHAFQLQVSNINGQLIPLGLRNTSSGQLGLTQNLFSSDALLASNSAGEGSAECSRQQNRCYCQCR